MKKVVKKTKREKIFKTTVQETDELSPEDLKELEVEKNEILLDLKNKLNDSEEESECAEEIEPDKKIGKKRKPKEKLSEEEKPKRKKKEKKPLLDPDFNLERDYFYQFLSAQEKEELKKEIENYFTADQEIDLKGLFRNYSNLSKSIENIQFVHNSISEGFKKLNPSGKLFTRLQNINELITNEYYTYRPTILEVYYFPENSNEVKVANMIRTAKIKLDIAIFTLTNDRIYAAIEEVHKRGVPVRLIADDEMAKCMGADVNKVAMLGIPVKMDDSVKYHMHNKFAVIDMSVIITGSFNWTTQAVQHNQENILFYENKDIAKLYAEEFERLWNSFTNVVTIEIAQKNIEEENIKKKEMQLKAQESKKRKKEEKDKLDKEKKIQEKGGDLK